MNCKPGMLVIVKKSEAGNEGRVGTVLRWSDKGERVWNDEWVARHSGWLVEGRFKRACSGKCGSGVFPDEWLIPIRDNDGEDEMLRVAGKPSDIKTKEIA